jgi:hypothetical protein
MSISHYYLCECYAKEKTDTAIQRGILDVHVTASLLATVHYQVQMSKWRSLHVHFVVEAGHTPRKDTDINIIFSLSWANVLVSMLNS